MRELAGLVMFSTLSKYNPNVIKPTQFNLTPHTSFHHGGWLRREDIWLENPRLQQACLVICLLTKGRYILERISSLLSVPSLHCVAATLDRLHGRWSNVGETLYAQSGLWGFWQRSIIIRLLGYGRVYLPLHNVADNPFISKGTDYFNGLRK